MTPPKSCCFKAYALPSYAPFAKAHSKKREYRWSQRLSNFSELGIALNYFQTPPRPRCAAESPRELHNAGFPGPTPSLCIYRRGAQAPGILRLSLDWEPLLEAQPLFSHVGKLKPGRTGDLSDLVGQAVVKPGLEVGPPSLSFLSFPSSSLALSLPVTQGSESSCGTTEETSWEKQSPNKASPDLQNRAGPGG